LEAVSQLQDPESECKKLQLSKEMDELLYREEIMWLQRSRVAWLREGDRNTKYFHRQATRRKKKNCINKLKRTDGSITSDALEMEELTHTFFQGLYTRDDDIDPSIITDTLQQLVDDDMNNILCADFTVKEINDALFQIGPLKAPGPDGFPVRLLQQNWELLRNDVVRVVQRFFTDGIMP
jgi:type III secretory pathway component EscR